jgi:hypothetical protein
MSRILRQVGCYESYVSGDFLESPDANRPYEAIAVRVKFGDRQHTCGDNQNTEAKNRPSLLLVERKEFIVLDACGCVS